MATVLAGWNFYKVVQEARKNPKQMEFLTREGFLTIETAQLAMR